MHTFLVQYYHTIIWIYELTHLMVFLLHGVASASGKDFCFLFDTPGILSSDFLFFASAAWACSSLKFRGSGLVGIVPGSFVLGLGSAVEPEAGERGLWDKFSSVCAPSAVLGDGPSLNTSRGCGSCWAGGGPSLNDAASPCSQRSAKYE